LLTVSEVAKRLKCHQHTVRRWIWDGKLAAVKVGDLVRVPATELEGFLKPARARKPAGASTNQARSKGVAALLATIRRLRRTIKPSDVEEMERRMAEGEQPAEWANPLA
jgi:excisionase family DNA binding protein